MTSLNLALLTISDTRDLAQDRSGDALAARIALAGHKLIERDIIRDDMPAITAKLRDWIARDDIQAIITTGGTGLTGRDVTVEAHRQVYEKEIEGFAVQFQILSHAKIGVTAMQSRACAGVAMGTYLFALPGSPSACRDAWDGILRHALDSRRQPSNLVDLMPRLQEK